MILKFLVKRTGMVLDVVEGTDVCIRLLAHPDDYQAIPEEPVIAPNPVVISTEATIIQPAPENPGFELLVQSVEQDIPDPTIPKPKFKRKR